MSEVVAQPIAPASAAERRAQALREGRRRASREKRSRVSEVLSEMVAAGEPVSYTAVAQRAGVSTWLVYAPGVREQVEAALAQQRTRVKPARDGTRISSDSVRTDLELARQEIRKLRDERDDLRRQLRGVLDRQLTNLSTAPLVDRIAALTSELTQQRQANDDLAGQVESLQDDLDATRRALRQMIKDASTSGGS